MGSKRIKTSIRDEIMMYRSMTIYALIIIWTISIGGILWSLYNQKIVQMKIYRWRDPVLFFMMIGFYIIIMMVSLYAYLVKIKVL